MISEKLRDEINAKLLEKIMRDKNRFESYGYVDPVNAVLHEGHRVVLLPEGIVTCSVEKDFGQNDFSKFLISHLQILVGDDWFNDQFTMEESKRHIIVRWFIKSGFRILDYSDPVTTLQVNSAKYCLLHLAYDLFVINNHGCLDDQKIKSRLLRDLKLIKNFNATRYEIFVFATLIRAGFTVTPLNQQSQDGEGVPECEAIFKKTNSKILVEAKVRNVKDIMGAADGNAEKIKIYRNLRKAVEKNIDVPYTVFQDINFPDVELVKKSQVVTEALEQLTRKYSRMMPNLFIFTNNSFPYDEENFSDKPFSHLPCIMSEPRVALSDIDEIANAIHIAMTQYKNIPLTFVDAGSEC